MQNYKTNEVVCRLKLSEYSMITTKVNNLQTSFNGEPHTREICDMKLFICN